MANGYLVVFLVLAHFVALFGIVLIRVDLYKIKREMGLTKEDE